MQWVPGPNGDRVLLGEVDVDGQDGQQHHHGWDQHHQRHVGALQVQLWAGHWNTDSTLRARRKVLILHEEKYEQNNIEKYIDKK